MNHEKISETLDGIRWIVGFAALYPVKKDVEQMRRIEGQQAWEREAKRAEAANTAAFFIALILILTLCLALIVSGASCRFSREKWVWQPQRRTRIVSDLLRRSDPTGMTLAEVTELLGAGEVIPERDGAFTLRYPLGADPVFVPNGAVLDIFFRDGIARRCQIIQA